MDFFRSAYASAKEQATKAAAEASKHANKAAAEARVLAEQAQAAAKQQAEDASKRLQELQSDFQKLDLASVKGSMKQALAGGGGSGGGCSPEELARYGLTEELVNHIKGFTYVTFSDFPEEQLVVTRGVGADAMSSVMKLGPWQQTHAMLLIQAIPAFNDLRYVLCPRKMPEERFWEVYFRLTAPYLPEESQQFELLSGGGTTAAAAAVVAAAAGLRLPESNSMGAFTLAQEEESAGEEASRYEADPEEEEEEGWGGGSESEVDEGSSLPQPASPAGAKAEAEAGAHPGSPSPSRPAAGDSESLPNTPGPTATQDGSSAADTPGTAGHEDASDDDLDDDFDAYVEGMLGGAGDADAEEGDADVDDDDDDFDEYMNELAKEAGGDAGDDDDISLGSDDLDLGELDGDEEDS